MLHVIWDFKRMQRLKSMPSMWECRHDTHTWFFSILCSWAGNLEWIGLDFVCMCLSRASERERESIIIIIVISSWCVYIVRRHTRTYTESAYSNGSVKTVSISIDFQFFPAFFLIKFKFRFRLMSTWKWSLSNTSLPLIYFSRHLYSFFLHFFSSLQFTFTLNCVQIYFFVFSLFSFIFFLA